MRSFTAPLFHPARLTIQNLKSLLMIDEMYAMGAMELISEAK